MADGHNPKVDSNAKFVGFVASILLLAAVYYLVTSLVHVVTRESFKDAYAPITVPASDLKAPPVAAAAPAAAPTAAPAAAPTATTTAASSGDAAAGKAKYATCAACHGADGHGNGGAFPDLTKLSAADAEAILHAFKKGDMAYLNKHGLGGARYSTMAPQAAGLSDADIANLGAYIAELGGKTAAAAPAAAPTATTTAASSGDAAAGKAKYATCAACHGADGHGNGGAFPDLTKLSAADAEAILHAFKKGDMAYLNKHGLGGARYSTMAPQAAGLSDADIANLGAYIAELGGKTASAAPAPAAAGAAPAAAAPAAPATPKVVSSDVVAWGHALFSSCAVCHGADGEGGKLFGAPKIAGLPYDSVISLLKIYRKGQQMGAKSYAMIPQAKNLTDNEIDALAAYVSLIGSGHDKSASATE